MSKLRENKKLFIILIVLVVVALSGGTYALYKLVLFNDLSVNVSTKGLDYYLNYNKGTNFTGGLELCDDYTDGSDLSITLYKKNNKYDHIYGHIYLKINDIGSNLVNMKALKYTVVDSNDTEIASGMLKGVKKYETVLLAHNIDLTTTETQYTVYIWLDKSEGISSSISGESFNASLVVEATQKQITETNFNGRKSYKEMTPQEKAQSDVDLAALWFNEERTKELNSETTNTAYSTWITNMGGSFPTCASSSSDDMTDCFEDDGDDDFNIDLYTLGANILTAMGLGNKGINFNSYYTMAFINESTNKICVTFKLGTYYNSYYGESSKDVEGNFNRFSTEDGYPLIYKSSGC